MYAKTYQEQYDSRDGQEYFHAAGCAAAGPFTCQNGIQGPGYRGSESQRVGCGVGFDIVDE